MAWTAGTGKVARVPVTRRRHHRHSMTRHGPCGPTVTHQPQRTVRTWRGMRRGCKGARILGREKKWIASTFIEFPEGGTIHIPIPEVPLPADVEFPKPDDTIVAPTPPVIPPRQRIRHKDLYLARQAAMLQHYASKVCRMQSQSLSHAHCPTPFVRLVFSPPDHPVHVRFCAIVLHSLSTKIKRT